VRQYARDQRPERLAATLRTTVPAFSNPFGALEAAGIARLVERKWREVSNRRDYWAAVLEGRPQHTDMPFDVPRVARAAMEWIDRTALGTTPDDETMNLESVAAFARFWGISRATAYRCLARSDDLEYVATIFGRAQRRRAVRHLVASGRSLAAARRLLDRHPELVGNVSAAPPARMRGA